MTTSKFAKHPALTPYARHLMSEVSKGRNRLWATVDIPTGWIHIERAGLATRKPHATTPHLDTAELTPAGHTWLQIQAARPGRGTQG